MKLLLISFICLTSISPLALAAPKRASLPMVTQTSQQKFEVSRKAVESEIKDPNKQLSTFSASPSFSDGAFSGIEIDEIKNESLLPKFGIQEGDVVEMINGTPLRFPTDIIEVGEKLSRLKKGSVVRVNLRRDSKSLTHSYLIID